MAITKSKKVEIVKEVENILNSKNVVFVNFHGLKVNQVTDVRKGLSQAGVNYFVTKKSLLRKALANKKIEGELPNLEGELAIVYGNDELAPSREIYDFGKKYKESLKILGGIFENKIQSQEQALALATIPSINVLYGQLVGMFISPIRGLVICLDQIAQSK